MEKEIGSIEKGKHADLVLLNQDVFSVPTENLEDTKPLWTMFNGQVVFDATKDSFPEPFGKQRKGCICQ